MSKEVQQAGVRRRHFDPEIIAQIDRIGYHPFIIVRSLDAHDAAAHFVVCRTQNDTPEFIRKLGASPCFAQSKLLRAIVCALQLNVYEAADLLFSWTTKAAGSPYEDALIGLPDGQHKTWFYGYPGFEIRRSQSALSTPEQQIATLISTFEAYDTTDGNDRLRFAIIEALAFGLCRALDYFGRFEESEIFVDRALVHSPNSMYLNAAKHALRSRLAGTEAPARLEKLIGTDNDYLKQYLCHRTIGEVTDVELSCVKQPSAGGELALFVTRFQNGRIRPHVRHHLAALKQHGIRPVLIVAAEAPFHEPDAASFDSVAGLYVRQNVGFDFAAWAHVLRANPQIFSANILYLINDSVIGPLNEQKFEEVLRRVRSSEADVIGLTDNFECGWHIQSYFIALKSKALMSGALREFFRNIKNLREKEDVTNFYEIRLAPELRSAGLRCEALFPAEQNHNPTTSSDWKDLIESGFPYVKMGVLRDDPLISAVLDIMTERVDDYQSWVERYDSLFDADRVAIRSEIDGFSERPLISVLMPVYNTDRKRLIRAIESVRTQLYLNWELCISDDASRSPHVKQILDGYSRIDRRIRVVYRDTNGDVSLNSNSALALATGEFIALLGHDDELPSHALFWVAREIAQCPHVDLIYSDEDRIDVQGRRQDAYFKSDWNPALILSQNFFNHLGVYRRSLVQQVGGFRVGFEGSQAHDLVIRCADASAPERIRHIPRVLYHRHSIEGSTAAGIDATPYTWRAGVRAIKEHLERHGIAADVGRALTQFYQVDYQVRAPLPQVSIVIPTTGNLKVFEPCIQSLFARTSYPDFEVLIAINKSHRAIQERGDYLDKLRMDPRVRILVHEVEPYSFAKVNNWAIQRAAGSVICLLNDDVEVIMPDWLEKLVMRLELERVGAVGPMLYYPDDTIQQAGVILGLGGVAAHAFNHLKRGTAGYHGRAALEQDLSCITAACMVMRRAVFEELNGFNEELAISFNDVDLCIRIRNAGWRIIWTPQVELYHHESASLGPPNSPERRAQFKREIALMRKMWGKILDNDPFYNLNLSLDTTNFTLAFPPRQSRVPRQ
jgi:GT2 family glycosyltransferase